MSHPETTSFTLKGRHVLAAFIVFFGMIIITDFTFVRLAVTSFPGEQVKKSYYQGLNYNDVLADKQRQAAKGWQLTMLEGPSASGSNSIALRLASKDGKPIDDAVVSATVIRPVSSTGEQSIPLSALGDGRYTIDIAHLPRGVWDLTVSATETGAKAPALVADKRLFVQ
ncbi:MAG: FixH family protein [Parvularculaceae bacterium]|nr:FixH family protein [Parvularculaceae bacterium]